MEYFSLQGIHLSVSAWTRDEELVCGKQTKLHVRVSRYYQYTLHKTSRHITRKDFEKGKERKKTVERRNRLVEP